MQGGRSTPLEHLRMAELPRPLTEGGHQKRTKLRLTKEENVVR